MKKLLTIFVSIAALLTACSQIDGDERLIYVSNSYGTDDTLPVVYRAALIEDYTAQYCVNCPNAADEIEKLIQMFGGDKVVAVGVHGGPLAHKGGKRGNDMMPLCTTMGDSLYDHWQIEAQPIGYINRTEFATHDLWIGMVREQINKTARVAMEIENSYQAVTNSIAVTVKSMGLEDLSLRLNVWLTEDDIVSPQMMPDGKANVNYRHNHVFRTSATGMWGIPITVKKGEMTQNTFTIPLKDDWDPQNISVVAFCNHKAGESGDDVEQAVKKIVIVE